MLVFAYLVLFLALSAFLTYWRVANYRRHYEKRASLAASAWSLQRESPPRGRGAAQ